MKCPACRGTGKLPVRIYCGTCGGKGGIIVLDRETGELVEAIICGECLGNGRIPAIAECPFCGGDGETSDN